eukprot:Colp12_sorted_trinity150504_noHs@15404
MTAPSEIQKKIAKIVDDVELRSVTVKACLGLCKDVVPELSEETLRPLVAETVAARQKKEKDALQGKCLQCLNSIDFKINLVVVGYGMAGQIRVRDAGQIPHFESKGVVSRRENVGTITFEEALNSNEVDAVAICTENNEHSEQVRAALNAGKHVLVEFPLSLSAKDAKELFDLAESKGLVLHVEHIELLSTYYIAAKEEILKHGKVKHAAITFNGGNMSRWMARPELSGFPSFSGIARATRLYDLVGPPEVHSATCTRKSPQFEMVAHLTAGGAPAVWTERRGYGSKRSTDIDIEFEDGARIHEWPDVFQAHSLFTADMCVFAHKVAAARGVPHALACEKAIVDVQWYSNKERVVACLETAEAVQNVCVNTVLE